MIPKDYIEFYGDQTRWFLGEVVDVENDPLKLGRVKVKVFGVYDEIDPVDLPWAQIVVPVTQGVHDGKGQYLGILKGTQVFGVFLDGQNSQLPMVIGTVPKKGDDNAKAKENYPHNKVYQTDRGHYKEWDDTEGKERIREQHKSGTFYEMMPDGSRETVVEENETLRVKGDATIKVGSKDGNNKANLTIIGDCNITVTGNATIGATNVSVNATEKVTVRAGGKVVLG